MNVSKCSIYCKGLPTSEGGAVYCHMLFIQNINPPNAPKSIVNLKLNNSNRYTISPSIPNYKVSVVCRVVMITR